MNKSVTAPPSDADLDTLIQSLYGCAVTCEWTEFRERGLTQLCEWTGASAAVWLTLSKGSVIGESTEYPAGLGLPPKSAIGLTSAGQASERQLKPVPAELQVSSIEASSLQVLRYPHRKAALESVLLFYFRGSATAQTDLDRAVGHLVEAGTLALQQYIQRDEWLSALGRANRGTTAVVDARGVVYAVTQRFRDLLGESEGTPDFTVLPFELPNPDLDGERDFVRGPLHFRVASLGHLFQLHARKPLPLDGLSPREQQIARALGAGKTFKSVARQYDIAVSTVANHASRIYRKLGIYRREDLVDLVRRPPAGFTSPAPAAASAAR